MVFGTPFKRANRKLSIRCPSNPADTSSSCTPIKACESGFVINLNIQNSSATQCAYVSNNRPSTLSKIHKPQSAAAVELSFADTFQAVSPSLHTGLLASRYGVSIPAQQHPATPHTRLYS